MSTRTIKLPKLPRQKNQTGYIKRKSGYDLTNQMIGRTVCISSVSTRLNYQRSDFARNSGRDES